MHLSVTIPIAIAVAVAVAVAVAARAPGHRQLHDTGRDTLCERAARRGLPARRPGSCDRRRGVACPSLGRGSALAIRPNADVYARRRGSGCDRDRCQWVCLERRPRSGGRSLLWPPHDLGRRLYAIRWWPAATLTGHARRLRSVASCSAPLPPRAIGGRRSTRATWLDGRPAVRRRGGPTQLPRRRSEQGWRRLSAMSNPNAATRVGPLHPADWAVGSGVCPATGPGIFAQSNAGSPNRSAYQVAISVSGNETPVGDMSVDEGSLPAGLTSTCERGSTTATISGTPQGAGQYAFTVSAWCLGSAPPPTMGSGRTC
jgi:hypothetical protein